MEPVCFLLYVSQVAPSAQEEAREVLREKALLNSSHQGITGLLVYRKGFFMQYLEGPASTVDGLFRELRGTSRHFNVRVLCRGVLNQRLFSDWSVRWVFEEEPGPSSESLIDLFETVFADRTTSSNEIDAVLRRFGKNSTVVLSNAIK